MDGLLALSMVGWMDGWIDGLINWLGLLTCIRDHGHAHGSRRSELTNYLGENLPWWDPWNSTGKPLLLVDPNWPLIGQLPSSTHHPLGCCVSTHGWPLSRARVLIGRSMGEHWRAELCTCAYVPTFVIPKKDGSARFMSDF